MNADYEGHARVAARETFERTADRDVHFFAGFVTSWMVRSLTLDQLTDLVIQLDAAFPERWIDSGSGPGFEDTGAVIELPDEPEENR